VGSIAYSTIVAGDPSTRACTHWRPYSISNSINQRRGRRCLFSNIEYVLLPYVWRLSLMLNTGKILDITSPLLSCPKRISCPFLSLLIPLIYSSPLDSPASSSAPTWRISMAEAPNPHASFWDDIKTGGWVVRPSSSFRLLLIPIALRLNWVFLAPLLMTAPPSSPFAPLLFISHPTPLPTNDQIDPPLSQRLAGPCFCCVLHCSLVFCPPVYYCLPLLTRRTPFRHSERG
jgi:hypothetical protein